MPADLAVEATTTLGDIELDVSLRVGAGECLALVGPSGAGKSSVLRVAAGLLRPRAGTVRCGEETWLDTLGRIDRPPEERRCGYVFQEYALFGHLSAWQNVAFALRDRPRAQRRKRAHELLERLGMAARADARPRTLSGGERQRVALARALARAPRAFLLDEPLSALDVRTRTAATRELAALLGESGVPALMVTHDFAQAAALGDLVGVVEAGHVVQKGTPAELAARPVSAFVADLTGAVVLTGRALAGDDGLTRVALEGGEEVVSPDGAAGPVGVSVFPWDITIEPPHATVHGSARNRLAAEVTSVTEIGGRVRLGLAAGQPLVAEVTAAAVAELGLRPGTRVVASFKATATRLVAR